MKFPRLTPACTGCNVFAWKFDWFVRFSLPVLIGQNYCFTFGFTKSIENCSVISLTLVKVYCCCRHVLHNLKHETGSLQHSLATLTRLQHSFNITTISPALISHYFLETAVSQCNRKICKHSQYRSIFPSGSYFN